MFVLGGAFSLSEKSGFRDPLRKLALFIGHHTDYRQNIRQILTIIAFSPPFIEFIAQLIATLFCLLCQRLHLL